MAYTRTFGWGYLTQPATITGTLVGNTTGTHTGAVVTDSITAATTLVTFASPIVLPNGTITDPALTFVGDSGTNGDGIYWDTGTSKPRLVADGVYALQWEAAITTLNGTAVLPTTTVSGALTTSHNRIATPPAAQSLTAAGDAITIGATDYNAPFTSTGVLTLTSAPTIANGTDGQEILLINVGSNNVTIQDQGTLASSNLRLTATGVTIAPRQSLRLMYSTVVGDWVQVGPLTAVL